MAWAEDKQAFRDYAVQTGHGYAFGAEPPFMAGQHVRFWEERFRVPDTGQHVQTVIHSVEWEPAVDMWACQTPMGRFGADMFELMEA